MQDMKLGIIAIILSVVAGVALIPISAQVNNVNAATLPQTGALVGYGGRIFGLVDVSSDGHQTEATIATNYIPPSGKVFEAWMVDGGAYASGYPLSLGQITSSGKLKFDEYMVNAYTYTNIVVTVEPSDDKDPKPNWSQQVGVYLLAPPFGQ